jgi:hypothetical protein
VLQLPKPPWYRRWSVILTGVVVLAAVGALIGWRGLQQVGQGATTVSSRLPPVTVPDLGTTTTRQAPTTTSLNPDLLWEKKGSDLHRGRLFEAPRRWRLVWSFDCSSFAEYGGGNFKLTGEGAFARVLIQEFDTKARGSQTMTADGRGRLIIDSVCERWKVQAIKIDS